MSKTIGNKVEREARLAWVPLAKMRINPLAQRKYDPAWVNKLYAEFNPERIGKPVVNLRDGLAYVCDGQHRIAALKLWLGDWEDQSVFCEIYEGLTEQQEADAFLFLNNRKNISTFAKFMTAITAGWPKECDINRIVRAQGLCISRNRDNGAIGAVRSLERVYDLGPSVLAQSLRVVRDAYGDSGFRLGVTVEGLALVCQRYNGEFDEATATQRLSGAYGGLNGLMNNAETLRLRTGWPRAHAIAAAVVDIYNRGRGGRKLQPWADADT